MKILRDTGHVYRATDGKRTFGPFPGVTAITGLHDSVGGSDGLLNWGVNLALDTFSRVLSETNDWEQARSEAWQAKNAARDLGTAVHAAVEQVNRGLPLETTERTAPYLAQYAAFLVKHRVEVIGAEQFVIHPDVGYGGTLDLLAKVDGATAMLDVKSGKAKASQRLQLAALSWAPLRCDPGGEAEPMPQVERHYILLLRPDTFELIEHDITDADRAHFARLVETYNAVWAWRDAARPAVEEKAA